MAGINRVADRAVAAMRTGQGRAWNDERPSDSRIGDRSFEIPVETWIHPQVSILAAWTI